MKIIQNYIWEQNKRAVNEDSMGIGIYEMGDRLSAIAIVCDGIGSLPQGEIASSFVTKELLKAMDTFLYKGFFKRKDIKNFFFRQLQNCHRRIKAYSRKENISMGTTVSILLILEQKAYLFQVGDGSIYGGIHKLQKLTAAHSERGCLKRAIGIGTYQNPDFKVMKLKENQTFLICSDGFENKAKEIIDYLLVKENSEEKIRKRLRDAADYGMLRGEKDNITAIILKLTAG